MATLIDASVSIVAERGLLDWESVVAEHGTTEGALAAITASELLHGSSRGVWQIPSHFRLATGNVYDVHGVTT